LVSAWPAKSLEVAQYIDGQVPLLAMTQNAQTGTTYSFVAADFTKLVTLSNASPVAVTLPLEATVPWPTGTQLRLLNQGAGTVTVAGAVGVTINGTPLTLGQYKGANLIKTGTNTWTFIPFASGVGAAVYSDANTGTYTGFAYKTFTASGTLTVTTAGFADVVLCAGGGGGGNSTLGAGGGAGGVLAATNVYLPVGTLTVTIGAGGAGVISADQDGGLNGISTRLDSFYAIGGGGGAGGNKYKGQNGGSGGGGRNATAGSGTPGQGFDGYNGGGSVAGGGGGASAAATSINGGAGTTTAIAGTTPSGSYVAGSYALGGGGGGRDTGTGGSGGGGGSSAGVGQNGTANTGGGGGGSQAASNGGNGGSGLAIVRVAV
jgi:hypothetical protein